MVQNLILVGAGASYGAGNVDPYNPPLGDDLFSKLESEFPELWGSLEENLASELRKDIEDGMEKIGEYDSTLYAPLYSAMGAYFAKFTLSDKNSNYRRLVSQLKTSISNGDTILSSTNYDCLMEESLSQINLEVEYFPDNIPEQNVLLKTHGSCNFLPETLSAKGISFDQGISFSVGINPVSREEVIEYHQSNHSLYPAMALYRPDKWVQISGSTVSDIQDTWKQVVQEVDRIGIIGAAPRPTDEHIWGPLARTDAKIFYIGGEDKFNSWEDSHRNGRDKFISNRFGEGVDRLVDEIS